MNLVLGHRTMCTLPVTRSSLMTVKVSFLYLIGDFMNENNTYWFWSDGKQYQIVFCEYSQEWSILRNDRGR